MHPRSSPFHLLFGGLMAWLVVAVPGCGSQRMTAPLVNAHVTPAASGSTRTAAPISDAAYSDQDTEVDGFSHAIEIDGPTVITQPGAYRVTRDFAADPATGDAIVVRTDNVRLWLGEHHLRGLGNKTGRGVAVENARQVRVSGGRLSTFGVGVVLSGADACAVRGVDVMGGDEFADPAGGIAPQVGIMLVNSAHCRIAQNELHGINLGIFVRGGGSTRNQIHANRVVGLTHGLLGICYNPAPTGGTAGPSRDEVNRNQLLRFGAGIQASAGSQHNRFVENLIEYFSEPYRDFNGTNVFIGNRATQVSP